MECWCGCWKKHDGHPYYASPIYDYSQIPEGFRPCGYCPLTVHYVGDGEWRLTFQFHKIGTSHIHAHPDFFKRKAMKKIRIEIVPFGGDNIRYDLD